METTHTELRCYYDLIRRKTFPESVQRPDITSVPGALDVHIMISITVQGLCPHRSRQHQKKPTNPRGFGPCPASKSGLWPSLLSTDVSFW